MHNSRQKSNDKSKHYIYMWYFDIGILFQRYIESIIPFPISYINSRKHGYEESLGRKEDQGPRFLNANPPGESAQVAGERAHQRVVPDQPPRQRALPHREAQQQPLPPHEAAQRGQDRQRRRLRREAQGRQLQDRSHLRNQRQTQDRHPHPQGQVERPADQQPGNRLVRRKQVPRERAVRAQARGLPRNALRRQLLHHAPRLPLQQQVPEVIPVLQTQNNSDQLASLSPSSSSSLSSTGMLLSSSPSSSSSFLRKGDFSWYSNPPLLFMMPVLRKQCSLSSCSKLTMCWQEACQSFRNTNFAFSPARWAGVVTLRSIRLETLMLCFILSVTQEIAGSRRLTLCSRRVSSRKQNWLTRVMTSVSISAEGLLVLQSRPRAIRASTASGDLMRILMRSSMMSTSRGTL